MLSANKNGFFPTTPATNLLYGLRESLQMLKEESLDKVFARHERHAEATRRAVRAWGLGIVCLFPEEYSASLTAVMLPAGHDADRVREIISQRFDMSLGMGLGKLQGKVFRIGHLGDFNDLSLAGTLCGVEMGLELSGIALKQSGVSAALEFLMHGNSRVGESTVEIRVPHI
jgi:alanine-glyoxylate transaminase/serine-glyoxylate transaminase/serine-pyruvate transaminase